MLTHFCLFTSPLSWKKWQCLTHMGICYTYLFIYPFISLASSGIVYQSSAKRRCPMSELFYFWTKFENFKDGISHYNWSSSAIYSMIIINHLIDYEEFFLNIVKSSFLKYFLPLLCYVNYFMTQKVSNYHSTLMVITAMEITLYMMMSGRGCYGNYFYIAGPLWHQHRLAIKIT